MPTDDHKILTSTVCVGQSLMLIEHSDFVFVMSQLMASLNKRLLVCSFTSLTLWSLEHCVLSDQ